MKWLPIAAAVLLLAGCTAPQTVADPTPPPAVTAKPTPTPTPPEPSFEAIDPALFFVNDLEGNWGNWSTADVNFAAPGGHVGCAILGAEHDYLYGCAIDDQKTWTFPTADPNDYCYESEIPCGFGIEATAAELPHPRHRGDPGYPGAFASYGTNDPIRVLEIGQSVTFGDVTCYSEAEGIRCENTPSGHGFLISLDRNDIF